MDIDIAHNGCLIYLIKLVLIFDLLFIQFLIDNRFPKVACECTYILLHSVHMNNFFIYGDKMYMCMKYDKHTYKLTILYKLPGPSTCNVWSMYTIINLNEALFCICEIITYIKVYSIYLY